MSSGHDTLGPYQLTRLIGSGACTQIWEGFHKEERKKIALKVLLKKYAKDRGQIALLNKEAEVGTTLNHKYIIKVYDFHKEQGTPFLTMELYPAKNLKQRLREDTELVGHFAGDILQHCAQSLSYLHKQGWVHCDVKPDNFLVSEAGAIKLIDFAICQAWPRRKILGIFGRSTLKLVSGTRSYMSPEQIRGKSLEPRCDIYSLGCVAFEMLGGRPPFTGSSGENLLAKHLKAKVPNVCALNDGVSSDVGIFIQKMMAKQPKDRPKSMDVISQTLKRLQIFKAGKTPRNPAESAKKEQG